MRLRDPLVAAISTKEGESMGGHLPKTQVDGQDQIRLSQDAFGIGSHPNPRLTDEQRICIVKKVMIAKTCDHWNIELICTGPQSAAVLAVPSAAARQDHRALGSL